MKSHAWTTRKLVPSARLLPAASRLSYLYMENGHNQIAIMGSTLARVDSAKGSLYAGMHVKGIIRYDKRTKDLVRGEETKGIHYYLSNLPGKVNDMAIVIRRIGRSNLSTDFCM